ncbi:MAG: Unknown protein [uncultured Sulfurovum sp.]|uniref:Uncharacterized protein n=1 Tax=uncultured Sulfurovum sp. TaxID=269237 RepID=A0A6S6TQV7_9BACT|nr:MAG: Unknown protein [uncultured Sulfurovum sp.]
MFVNRHNIVLYGVPKSLELFKESGDIVLVDSFVK